MKLNIREENNDKMQIYISLMPYEETQQSIDEDMIEPDDPIRNGSTYSDQLDTRKFIAYYLNDVAKEIEKYPFVSSAKVRKASLKTKRGLSSYIDIVFIHPDIVSKEIIKKHYTYSLRFSDHPGSSDNLIGCVDMVGRKPKNLMRYARQVIIGGLDKVQENISTFEMDYFNEVRTKLKNI